MDYNSSNSDDLWASGGGGGGNGDDELVFMIETADNENSSELPTWLTPLDLIKVLTTVLVPLVFGIIVVVGIIGNALVILVVVTNHQMRNTTNVLILNLALADLLFIVLCVPFTATDYVLNRWPFGLTWCKLVQYLIYVTSYVSIYTLILMSFDRFLAVVFPVSSLPYRTVRNAFCATLISWGLIGSVSTPIWFAHYLQQRPSAGPNHTADELTPLQDEQYWCRFSDEHYSSSGFYISFFVSGYAIPLLLIVLMYLFMLKRLWHPNSYNCHARQLSRDALRNKRRVTKLVLVVIIVFAFCWAPIQFVLLLKAMRMYSTKGPEDFPRIIFQILSHVLAYVNSCVNPILYAFLSDNFRKAFHQLLPSFCHKRTSGIGGVGGGTVAGASGGRRSGCGGGGGRQPGLQYELTTLRPSSSRSAAAAAATGSNGQQKKGRRFGKRGKLVKHENGSLSVMEKDQMAKINEVNNSNRQEQQQAVTTTTTSGILTHPAQEGEVKARKKPRGVAFMTRRVPEEDLDLSKEEIKICLPIETRTIRGEEGILCTEL